MITARNYAAQVERDMKNWVDQAKKIGRPHKAAEMYFNMIKDAVHFALPDNGRILNDNLKGLFGKKVRLPYPVITIEYYVHQKPTFTENGIEYQAICPKRFALASERKVGEKYVIDLCVVNYISTFSKWLPQPLGFVLDWGEKETFSKDGRVNISGYPFTVDETAINLLRKKVGDDKAHRMLTDDISDEVSAVLEMCEALTCGNVSTEPLEKIDVAKQAKRARQGKLPMYETRVLTISGEVSGRRDSLGGTHSSPRQHLRRGHIRRLPKGNIWVNSAVVGNPLKGIIEKSYEIGVGA